MARTGCQTCKIRRIKCDGTEPICQRCAKSRRACTKDSPIKPARISFHLENEYASGGTKRPRGPRPRTSLSLLRPASDILSQAVTYYFNHYLDHFEDTPTFSACMSECVTEWKTTERNSRMVDLATSAVALGIFSHTQQYPPAAREAVQSYSRLLGVVRDKISQRAILGCDKESFDEFLITIVVMAWYETVMHQCVNVKSRDPMKSMHSWSHHDGALAILKVWSKKCKDSPPTSIIKQTRRGLLRSAISRNYMLPDWVRDGSRFGEEGLDLKFDAILVQVADLKYAFKALGRDEGADPSLSEKIYNQARDLDKQCSRWGENLPDEWSYESRRTPNLWPRTDFGNPTAYVCSRHTYAAVWVQYFAVQLLINNIRLNLLQRSFISFKNHDARYRQYFEECQIQLKTLAHDLTCIIPFSLGRIKTNSKVLDSITLNTKEEIPPSLALPVVWSLSVVSSLDGIESEQQLWFRTLLARLGRVLGDGALECAGTDLWTHS
ncbi:hypothetical protein DL98DRAFT_631678 [Cadophora sp. DSE1049]|nr:hypothetical protein DL98DRAFT_631678 [Cadophora sp. DSE1049]